MEIIKQKSEQSLSSMPSEKEASPEQETKMEEFYAKHLAGKGSEINIISSEAIKELKNEGIRLEQFLDYLCQKHSLLLHGSVHEIKDNHLKSGQNKIFASNKSAIAIMRSLYSNQGANLEYPYNIDEEHPLELKIHTNQDGEFIKQDQGYIYLVSAAGFRNEPKGSWQFIREAENVRILSSLQTEDADFQYPVTVTADQED